MKKLTILIVGVLLATLVVAGVDFNSKQDPELPEDIFNKLGETNITYKTYEYGNTNRTCMFLSEKKISCTNSNGEAFRIWEKDILTNEANKRDKDLQKKEYEEFVDIKKKTEIKK